MSARNPGKRQAPPDDTIEDPATIAAMNEDAGRRAEHVAEVLKTPVQADAKPEVAAEDEDDDLVDSFNDEVLEDLEDALGEAVIDLTSLRGDLRDAMLEQFKRRPKPWDQMLEGQKHDVVAALNNSAETIIRKIVIAIASADRIQVAGTLEQLTVKDGIKATLKAPYSIDSLHALGEAQGKQVLIVVADAGHYMGERRKPKVEPDQGTLIPENDEDLANTSDAGAGASPFGGTESTGPGAEVGAQAAAHFEADNAGADGPAIVQTEADLADPERAEGEAANMAGEA